jgi:protein SCO1/2
VKFFIFLFFVCSISQAGLPPPDFSKLQGKQLSKRIFTTSQGTSLDLTQLQDSSFILVPLYTGCLYSCPLVIKNLISAYKELPDTKKIPVILFSFDPDETLDSMKTFEQNMKLPAKWFLVTLFDKNGKQSFLDEIGFHYFNAGNDQFEHPNIAYIFRKKLTIFNYILGITFNKEELKQKIESTQTEQVSTKFLFYLFCISVLSFIIIFIFRYKRKA